VHLAVIDPGVGTGRACLAVESDGRYLVGPDNGILSPALLLAGARAVSLPVPSTASRTFHARDVFAPVAAALSRGTRLDDLGTTADAPIVRRTREAVRREDGAVLGEVIAIDRFGNAITNLLGARSGVVAAGGRPVPIRGTYADVAVGAAVAISGSTGLLKSRCAGARRMLGLTRGAGCLVQWDRRNIPPHAEPCTRQRLYDAPAASCYGVIGDYHGAPCHRSPRAFRPLVVEEEGRCRDSHSLHHEGAGERGSRRRHRARTGRVPVQASGVVTTFIVQPLGERATGSDHVVLPSVGAAGDDRTMVHARLPRQVYREGWEARGVRPSTDSRGAAPAQARPGVMSRDRARPDWCPVRLRRSPLRSASDSPPAHRGARDIRPGRSPASGDSRRRVRPAVRRNAPEGARSSRRLRRARSVS
jgi:hypothetical protein